jgi:hypothetical protein
VALRCSIHQQGGNQSEHPTKIRRANELPRCAERVRAEDPALRDRFFDVVLGDGLRTTQSNGPLRRGIILRLHRAHVRDHVLRRDAGMRARDELRVEPLVGDQIHASVTADTRPPRCDAP